MDTNQSNYVVVEDFLTAEEAKSFCDAILANCEPDSKPLYRYMHIEHRKESPAPIRVLWDPNHKLNEAVEFARNHFSSTYKILGNLEFSRIFGNVMEEGAYLGSHRDEDANMDGVFDGKKRSFVAGLFTNDDYEGGNLVFSDQDVELKPKAGTLVLFPGFYTNHGVNEILSGLRVNILIFFYDMVDHKPEA